MSTTRWGYINANDVKAFFILGIICDSISFTTSSALMYSSAKKGSDQFLLDCFLPGYGFTVLLATWDNLHQ